MRRKNVLKELAEEIFKEDIEILVKSGIPAKLVHNETSDCLPFCLLSPNDNVIIEKDASEIIYKYKDDTCFTVYPGLRSVLDNIEPTTNRFVIPKLSPSWTTPNKAPFALSEIVVDKTAEITPEWLKSAMVMCFDHKNMSSNIASWAIAHNSAEVLSLYDFNTSNKIPENRLTSVLADKLIVTRRFDVLEYLVRESKKNSEDGKLPVWIVDALNKRFDEIASDEYRIFIYSLIND